MVRSAAQQRISNHEAEASESLTASSFETPRWRAAPSDEAHGACAWRSRSRLYPLPAQRLADAGGWSALLNVITSFALIGLLTTGVLIWARRKFRRRKRRPAVAAAT